MVTRDQLMDAVADRGWEPDERGIDAQIDSLRRKIDPDVTLPSVIRTIPRIGYMFVPLRG